MRLIAEVGVNHNGDRQIGTRLVDAILAAGAKIVKFQAFVSSEEISKFADKPDYQKRDESSKSQLELCQNLELSFEDLEFYKDYTEKNGGEFLCTAFDPVSFAFLRDKLKVKSLKIPSPEITNTPFLREIAEAKLDVILSTGASTLEEVKRAVNALRGSRSITLLHCVSAYPTPFEEANLRAIETLRASLNLPVGFSDHTEGIWVAVMAATLGAVYIEKHVTLDRSMPGPDHAASIEPDELKLLVSILEKTSAVLGDGEKVPAKSELGNLPLIRKSLVAKRDLKAGEVLTADVIGIKRPRTGIEPFDLDKVLGKKLKVNVAYDQSIKWDDIE